MIRGDVRRGQHQARHGGQTLRVRAGGHADEQIVPGGAGEGRGDDLAGGVDEADEGVGDAGFALVLPAVGVGVEPDAALHGAPEAGRGDEAGVGVPVPVAGDGDGGDAGGGEVAVEVVVAAGVQEGEGAAGGGGDVDGIGAVDDVGELVPAEVVGAGGGDGDAGGVPELDGDVGAEGLGGDAGPVLGLVVPEAAADGRDGDAGLEDVDLPDGATVGGGGEDAVLAAVVLPRHETR